MYIHSCRCRVWFTTLGTDRVSHLDPTTAWGKTALVHFSSQVVPKSACEMHGGDVDNLVGAAGISARHTLNKVIVRGISQINWVWGILPYVSDDIFLKINCVWWLFTTLYIKLIGIYHPVEDSKFVWMVSSPITIFNHIWGPKIPKLIMSWPTLAH